MDNKAGISEIFSSVQGEGLQIGRRQIFVRFSGCNLDCSFCDTDKESASCASDIKSLFEQIDTLNASCIHNSIAITGGEPLMHSGFLKAALPGIIERGFKVYLETNGTLADNLAEVIGYLDTLSIDIKLPSVSNNRPCWDRHKRFLEVAFEKEFFVKVVVSDSVDIAEFDKATALLRDMSFEIPFVIQPETKKGSCALNISADNILSLQERALKALNKVYVIPQAHKMLGVR